MKERVRHILTDLERVRENLLALSDDIWLSIDHNDMDARREGVEFKQAYNDKMGQFNTIVTWRWLYVLLCQQLAAKDGALFARLPANPDYVGKKGTKAYSAEPTTLKFPMQIVDGVYAEGNLSANSIRDRIKRLLSTFGIDQQDVQIYLREDRDAAHAS